MTLDPRQRLLLRAADGLATADELGGLRAEGIDVDVLVRQQAALHDALVLALSSERSPDVADAVMSSLALPDRLGPALRDALSPSARADESLPGRVLDAVGLSDDSNRISALLRDALTAPAPDVADAVMAALAGMDVTDGSAADRSPTDGSPTDGSAADVGALLRDAVAEERGTAPDLVGDVLAATGLSDDSARVGDLLRETLRPGEAPDLADDIMAALDQDGVLAGGDPLRSDALDLGALEHGALDLGALLRDDPNLDAPPDVADDVMAALGLASPGAALGEEDLPTEQVEPAAAAEDDDVDNVVPLVPAAAPPAVVAPAAAASPVTAGRPAHRRPLRWALPAMAAAAAAVMVVVTGGPTPSDDSMAFQLAAVNSVEIEELTAGDEVFVQVMQSEANAPTIIFIDELEGGMPL